MPHSAATPAKTSRAATSVMMLQLRNPSRTLTPHSLVTIQNPDFDTDISFLLHRPCNALVFLF